MRNRRGAGGGVTSAIAEIYSTGLADPRSTSLRRRNLFRIARLRDFLDVRRVQALGAGANLELHELALGKGLKAVHRDRREVHEDIFAAVLFDEAEALGVIEPFHFALCHGQLYRNDRY